MFSRMGGYFDSVFGHGWQKGEKAFWEEVSEGRYEAEPVILNK